MITGRSRQRAIGAQVSDEIEAVHPRHLDVGKDDLRHLVGQPLEGVEAVLGERDPVALADQQALGHAPHGQRIVDDEDQRRQRRRGAGHRHERHGRLVGAHRRLGRRARADSPYSVASATGL